MSQSQIPASEMATAFDPKPVEAKWGQFWLENHLGRAGENKTGHTFVLTIPPPNVTGVLHLGHALQHSIHDALLRYHRMKGDATLCVPGTDHAGIATQIKVEAKLREEENLSRHDLGREEFIARVYDWKNQYGATIIEQMKALGCSYDWERERFTMDDEYVKAVLTVFKAWFDRGLIYRGFRLVNWSSGAQTTVSDLEIEYKEVNGSLTYIKYPVEGAENEFVTVATSRPETMLGDSAVAVHPDDERYSHLRGKNVILPLQNRAIPLVFDAAVDKEFGTGAVKITPAHDPNDYEMGNRHGLKQISVIGFDDKINENGGNYAGMEKFAARKQIVRDLTALGLIEKIEPLVHSVGHCARTGVVIEPLLSEQWFVAMKELARPVADAIRIGRVQYQPERFKNTSLEWLDGIRDWCISRQLWWGHRIPIWYGPNGETQCSLEPIEGWTQDEDVLDTWFSSALWPFAVLGWPDNLERQFYPTSLLITGRDILHLWVSRMIATSLDFIETDSGAPEVPFHGVFVHPTIQDCFGLRMSKSLGTGIDPLELIEIYGADATRFGLLQLATGAQDVRFMDNAEVKFGEIAVRKWMRENKGKPLPLNWNESDGKPTERYPQMQSARGFANKIWNAARLVLSAESGEWNGELPQDLPSRWIASRLNSTIETVTSALENNEFESATSALYSFIWGDFCNWFLETSKPQLRAGDQNHITFMAHILEVSMRLLQPFMPFLSEEIWSKITGKSGLCWQQWPVAGEVDAESERDFVLFQDMISTARNKKAEAEVSSKKVKMVFIFHNDHAERVFEMTNIYVRQMLNLENKQSPIQINGFNAVMFADDDSIEGKRITKWTPNFEVILPLEGLIDVGKERAKLEKQLETAHKDLSKVEAKLSNPNFIGRASYEVVLNEAKRKDDLKNQIEKFNEQLNAL